jgi:hypothetical protein
MSSKYWRKKEPQKRKNIIQHLRKAVVVNLFQNRPKHRFFVFPAVVVVSKTILANIAL